MFVPRSGIQVSKKQKCFFSAYSYKINIVGSLCDREVACSASNRQGSNLESCVWRAVSSHLSHHPQDVLLAQFSLYVHKGGLKPHSFNSFHFTSCHIGFLGMTINIKYYPYVTEYGMLKVYLLIRHETCRLFDLSLASTKHLYNAGPTLHKCDTNVLFLLSKY